MANENTKTLSEGIAFMEKCLDTMLSEQRKAAHSAIDMDDWSKTEEIIAATKKNIVRIESLKAKFEDFKAEAVKLEFISADGAAKTAEQSKSEAKPAEQPKPEPKPAEQPKPEPKPAEQSEPKPVEQPKPEPKPAEQPKSESKPAEQPKPEPKPAEQPKPEPKPAEQPKPEPKPAEQPKPEPKPAEQPKPESKPAEQPKPAPKPAEQPKPAPKPAEQPKPAPKPAEQPKPAKPNPLDMEMTDFDDDGDTQATKLIIDACEKLITRFPFSMRLIYSNQKIGKFFTADEVIAENDMSKPRQLSNGLWVETNVPDEKVPTFIRSVTRYCEDSVNM